MDGGALEKARKRAEQLKLRNVEFIQGDIRNIALPGPFDAAVGRLVLLYFADPVTALAQIAAQVRHKGKPFEMVLERWCPGSESNRHAFKGGGF